MEGTPTRGSGEALGAAWNARNRRAAFEGATRLLAVSRYLADVALGAGADPARCPCITRAWIPTGGLRPPLAARPPLTARPLLTTRPPRATLFPPSPATASSMPPCQQMLMPLSSCSWARSVHPEGRRRSGARPPPRSCGAPPASPRSAWATVPWLPLCERTRTRARDAHRTAGSRARARLGAPQPDVLVLPTKPTQGQAGGGGPRPARGAGVRRARRRVSHGRDAGDGRARGLAAHRRAHAVRPSSRSIDEAVAWSAGRARGPRGGSAARGWTRERSLQAADRAAARHLRRRDPLTPRPTGRPTDRWRPTTGWPRRRAGCPGPRPW